jgi:hypothetical protein
MKSNNPADYTNAELRAEISRGGRLVVFPYCVSPIVVTLRRHTRAYVFPFGESHFGTSLKWALVSFLFGWWGIPWGFIYTPPTLWRTLNGGIDITDAWRTNYDNALRTEEAARFAALQQQEQEQPASVSSPMTS